VVEVGKAAAGPERPLLAVASRGGPGERQGRVDGRVPCSVLSQRRIAAASPPEGGGRGWKVSSKVESRGGALGGATRGAAAVAALGGQPPDVRSGGDLRCAAV
jgi:hypothetical protein